MKKYKYQVAETAEYLKSRFGMLPDVGLLAGTGLAESVEFSNMSASFDYHEIPHFPTSTVKSHFGKLLLGRLHTKTVAAFQGRFHLYEGYTPLEVTFPIRVMQELGVGTLIITNAAGGINPDFETGDLMFITDHINLTGSNPLAGPNQESWGIRFPDMGAAYDRKLAASAENIAEDYGIQVQKGVYVGLQGPSLETPAEIRFLRTIGADAVGFSTVLEVIAAVHAGMRVLGISTITNVHNPDAPVPASVEEIIAVAEGAAPRLGKIIQKVIQEI